VEGKWEQVKGSIKERWGKLTDSDLTVIGGKKDQLIGKIQERYGIAREEAQKQVESYNIPERREQETVRTEQTRERKIG
jgi:uncharacterized protein YjbJ (UPF0337 family)